MDKPKVSVIIGIYNVADTLGEALDSVFAQTYQNFEVILCDDGSTDNTMEIARAYQQKEPERVVLLSNGRNKGLNYTLNHCLKHVRGEYVARMDGDDLCVPERFEKQVKFLDEHPDYAIVSSPMIFLMKTGSSVSGKRLNTPGKKILSKIIPSVMPRL